MPKDQSGNDNKSKMLFQNPDDNLEKFDYINKFEAKQNNTGKGISGVGTNLGVKILEKLFGFLKKENNQNSDF